MTTPARVPFLNLNAQHSRLRSEIMNAIETVLDDGNFTGGSAVARFEREFAAYCGSHDAVGVGSGSDALLLALWACGIGEGDEVITVPNTFIATAEAISLAGATPVFVDVLPDTGSMDPSRLENAITSATRAILPVHLFGNPADMEPILRIARRHHLRVIEDACQAHGSLYKGQKIGTLGDVACFSFYPGKNLGALGDAGAVVSNDAQLISRVRALREHGQTHKNVHAWQGWTARMDSIQAAVLSVKLAGLDQANAARRLCAKQYDTLLADIPDVFLPQETPGARQNHHLYAIRTPRRDELLQALADQGIVCGLHYPTPIHLQPSYRHLGLRRGRFPVAEQRAEELLSLPIHPELTASQIETVCSAISRWHARHRIPCTCVA